MPRVSDVLGDRVPPAVPRPRAPGLRLRPPAASSTELPRERLLRWLDDAAAPVTLVCGHAGAGKTSLLAAWATAAAGNGQCVAWYGLDRFDDDPGLLWDGILAALRSIERFPPTSDLHDLVASTNQVTGAFVDTVVGAVEALGSPVWLVLDDVHVLTNPDAVGSLARLARRASEDLRLVLVSRNDPPIGLPRLRVEGRVRELRGDDLAFTIDETTAYLEGQGVDLPSASIRTLQERTEGWAAGIRIAALALEGSDDRCALIERFGGDDHAIADYLVTEVLANVAEERRAFLLRTSVCSLLRVDLARVLSGRDDAGALLDALERDHVFTQRHGRTREAYRYHELFRTYLLAELRRVAPQTERELHRAAAHWHAAHGETLQAIEHLIRGRHVADLAEVIGPAGLGAILDGQAQAVATILAGLEPRDRSVPMAALLGCAAALELGELDDADRWLGALVPATVETIDDPALAVLTATVAVWRARATDRVEDALARLEATSAGATGVEEYDLLALHERGVGRLYVGRYGEANDDLERAARLARVTGRHAFQLSCRSFLAGGLACESRLVASRAQAEAALGLAERRGWAGSQAVAHAHLLVGWSAYLQADRELASAHAQLGVASLGPLVDPDVELGVRSLDLVVAADGEAPYEALRAYRDAFERLGGAQMAPALLAYAAPLVLRICLDLGERSWTQLVVQHTSAALPDTGEVALLRAMVLHDAGRFDAARATLGPIVRGEVRCHVVTTEVHARCLAAELELRRGAGTRAHELVAAAVELAADEEVIRPLIDRPAALEVLTAGRGRFGRYEPFVERVLGAVTAHTSSAGHDADRLTPGELAVLRELPSLLSLREIAEARAVSVNTVKTHLRSIYRKLGVEGRRDAVETGRRRGLL
jgi:LuxR family transcriptional regulator, maltose regulon positive regulatory protein